MQGGGELTVMGTTPAVPAKRGRDLAELILAESGRAGLVPGSRLPTERRLATDLGVTRSGIRLALAALEADGLISREVGRGTFLLDAAADALAAARDAAQATARADEGETALGTDGDEANRAERLSGPARHPAAPDFAPADVMTVRRLIEPQALPLVVLWATARDFAEMDRCVAGGDRAATYEEFETWDLALHRAIIAAAHSQLLAALYGVVESARHGQVWGDLKRRSATRQRRELYQQDHRAIVAALRARDADGAVEAMRAHLTRVAGHLLGDAP
jgi:GntR family transcriptional regulator, uxu operon transcriptional repressor